METLQAWSHMADKDMHALGEKKKEADSEL